MSALFTALVRNEVPEPIAREIDAEYERTGGSKSGPIALYLERLSLQIWDAVGELGGQRDRAAAGGAP
jgi:hypothetical protein